MKKIYKSLIIALSISLSSCSLFFGMNNSEDGLSRESAFTANNLIKYIDELGEDRVSGEELYFKGLVSSSTYDSIDNKYTLYIKDHELSDDKPIIINKAKLNQKITENYTTNDAFKGLVVLVKGYFYNTKIDNKTTYQVSYLRSYQSPTGKDTYPSIEAIIGLEDENGNIHEHTYDTNWSSDENYHFHKANCGHDSLIVDKEEHIYSDWKIELEATSTSTGIKYKECITCGHKVRQTTPKSNNKSGDIVVYSFNDFHGAVKENKESYRLGIAKFGTYLKEVSKEDNVLIIDSGDTYQGSLESNSNRGNLIQEVFDYAHVDVHTIGNHDFDWGQTSLEEKVTKSRSGSGFKTTFLAGNIYDYDPVLYKNGNLRQNKFGDEYFIKTMKNGLKVGVIGVIGDGQITSINSPFVNDICFIDHVATIKTLSDKLRNELNCDVIIASVHEGISVDDGLKYAGLSEISPNTYKPFVDYVVGGHTHYKENVNIDNIYYTQAGCYGENIYKATLSFNKSTLTKTTIELQNYSYINSKIQSIDPNVTEIINKYKSSYEDIGETIFAKNVSTSFSKREHAPNLMAKAIYEIANKQFNNVVDIGLTNEARNNLPVGNWTYSDLFEAFPFDNVIYVVKLTGQKNINEIWEQNYCYHRSTLTSVNKNNEYICAVPDYLLFHVNEQRRYNYFDFNNLEILGTLKNSNNEDMFLLDVLVEYLSDHLNDTYRISDYTESNSCIYRG